MALLAPATAQASARDVIRDCADNGRLDRDYSKEELKRARKNMPADLIEYSDCREVINAALSGGPGSIDRSGGGGGGGGFAGGSGGAGAPIADAGAAAADANALEAATKKAKNPSIQVGDKVVKPGKNGLFGVAGVPNGMPLPLTIALLAVAAVAVGTGAFRIGRRIPALAGLSVPRPSLRSVSFPRLRR